MTRPSSLLASIILHAGLVVAVACWMPMGHRGMPGEGGGTPEFNAFFLETPTEAAAEEAAPPELETEFSEMPATEPELEPSSGFPIPPIIVNHAFAIESSPSVGIQDLTLAESVKKPSRRAGRSRRSAAGVAGSRSGGGGGSGSYSPPRYAHCPAPSYPPAARAAHQSGLALLCVSVDAGGAVVRVTIRRSTGSRILDNAALAAVRTWRFFPAKLDQTSVAAEVEVPVRFVL